MPPRSSALRGAWSPLSPEVAPVGIRTMLVEPGIFRTELLSSNSTTYAKQTREIVTSWSGMDGKQGGDPPRSPTLSCISPDSNGVRHASPPVPMPSNHSRPKPVPCSLKRTLTADCHPPSLTRMPDHGHSSQQLNE